MEENKVFIEGRVSVEEERDGKLICEKVTSFDEMPRNVWLRFPNLDSYISREKELFNAIAESDGPDRITIFLSDSKQKKQLPPNRNIRADGEVMVKLREMLGDDNVKVV